MITLPYLETLRSLPGGDLTAAVVILLIFLAAFQAALIIILKVVKFLVGKTETTLDDRILHAIRIYLPWIALASALWLAAEIVYPSTLIFGTFTGFDAYVILMLAILGIMLSTIADAFLLWYGLEIRAQGKKVNENEIFPFVRNVVKIGIILIFLVFVLQRLGFDTTAIITGLGVGGLAVALALQDTLGNFFGGMHILIDKPFKEDDYIKMENGLEGTVKQIGWRTTRLLTYTQNEIIVPNSKLSSAVLENYSKPDEKAGLSSVIGVDYKEDFDSVEKILSNAIKAASEKNQTIDSESIWVRFDGFGDYSLNFKYGFLVDGYQNRFSALREANREIFYAFKKNNINIPFPVRVIYNAKEKENDKDEKNKEIETKISKIKERKN